MNSILKYTLISFSIFSCTAPTNRKYANELERIDRWLKTTKIADSQIWPDALDNPGLASLSYSDGVAGKLIFYLQLFKDTKNPEYLNEVTIAADYILENLPQKEDSLQGTFWAFSPYGAVCGAGFALAEVFKATNESKYKAGVEHIVDVVNHFAINKEDTVSWGPGNDVLGGLAGTGLFILYAGETLERPELINIAERAGSTLIYRAKKEVGYSWKRGQNGRFDLPNFSHGAAGIGYFLARLYGVTGDTTFLNAALESNKYLESIAKTENGVFLIPYGFPDPGWSRPYDIGWAHGPAGVARFYRQLYKVTNEQKWLERELACLNGILSSGIPGQPASDDFGQDEFYLDNRFGIGSVASFLLDIELKGQEQKEFLNTCIDIILAKSAIQNNQQYWPQTRYNFMQNAGDTTAFTGIFYGAAGYGQILLKAKAKSNQVDYIRFVDDPY